MKIDLKPFETVFLTFFGVGLLPKMPGTFASLATLPFLYFLGKATSPLFLVIFISGLIILAIASCFIIEGVQKRLHVHDPPWIVIDEVLGMGTAWALTPSSQWPHLIVLFLLFRFFDIIKVWPASFFDQKIRHGAGTVLDDVASGLYTGGVCLALFKM